jgi:5'-methylthioadenosine nucleosidase
MHHDRRIPLPGFDKFGLGLVASPPTPALQAALGLKPGVVTSGDSLDYTDKCLEIMEQHGAAVKEMEAGSIAWAAGLHGAPLLCIKAITDIVDGGRATEDEFLENLAAAAAALRATLPRVLDFIAGKRLSEL